jgi:hypothetical protein
MANAIHCAPGAGATQAAGHHWDAAKIDSDTQYQLANGSGRRFLVNWRSPPTPAPPPCNALALIC